MVCHGWPIRAPEVEFAKLLAALPEPILHEKLVPAHDTRQNLFVDGSCLLSHEPSLRIAAWAVTWAGADLDSIEHRIVCAGHVPGLLQSAYRGELWALLMALQVAVSSDIDVLVCQGSSETVGP